MLFLSRSDQFERGPIDDIFAKRRSSWSRKVESKVSVSSVQNGLTFDLRGKHDRFLFLRVSNKVMKKINKLPILKFKI